MAELVEDGRTGYQFEPGNAEDLASKIQQLLADPRELAQLRSNARSEYEQKYTAHPNYEMLMEVYERAVETARRPLRMTNGEIRMTN